MVVIGGGQAGLAVGYHLRRLDPGFVVGRLGDVAAVVVNQTLVEVIGVVDYGVAVVDGGFGGAAEGAAGPSSRPHAGRTCAGGSARGVRRG